MSGDRLANEIDLSSPDKQRSGDAVMANKCVISDFKGKVHITFAKPCDGLTLDIAQANQMGEALCRQAYKAYHGDHPTTTDRSQVTEQIRVRARNRVAMMLQRYNPKTELERKQKAASIVEEVMKMFL